MIIALNSIAVFKVKETYNKDSTVLKGLDTKTVENRY